MLQSPVLFAARPFRSIRCIPSVLAQSIRCQCLCSPAQPATASCLSWFLPNTQIPSTYIENHGQTLAYDVVVYRHCMAFLYNTLAGTRAAILSFLLHCLYGSPNSRYYAYTIDISMFFYASTNSISLTIYFCVWLKDLATIGMMFCILFGIGFINKC
jgi:hypothetical protein